MNRGEGKLCGKKKPKIKKTVNFVIRGKSKKVKCWEFLGPGGGGGTPKRKKKLLFYETGKRAKLYGN